MAMEKSEKTKAVEAALLNIEKQFGKGSVMRLGDHRSEDVPVISTSSIGLDSAVGVGGAADFCSRSSVNTRGGQQA